MRMKTEQIVQVWRRDAYNGSYNKVASFHQVLADPRHLFAIDVSAYPFASPGLRITENSDNSLKSMEVSSTENESGAISAAATGLTNVNTARTTAAAACQTAIGGTLAADQAVAAAQATLDALDATASSELRLADRQVLASAQAAAKTAHAKAVGCH
jgi:hypothetical protein